MIVLTDEDHQALDIDIGRILEIYLKGEIDQNTAKADLSQFFDSKAQIVRPNDIHVYLKRILQKAGAGDISGEAARSDLVKAAIASQKRGPELGDLIHLGAD